MTEAPTYRCFLCGFRIDTELCLGSYIRTWKVTVCANCLNMSRSGIQPTKDMLAKLGAAHVNLALNKAGKIDWPETIEDPILPAEYAPRLQKGPRHTFIWRQV
ncbi:MAG TPA: hypothetical protein VKB67_14570 [Rhizomicrobium sp.]|nr:hypothetical protein [Rhizomicrobium sp.]